MKFQVLIVLIAAATAVAANGATICAPQGPMDAVGNCDFATPSAASTGGFYSPVPGVTSWTFTGSSGIAAPGANSPWAPFSEDGSAGSQVAFLQQQNELGGGSTFGSFSQSLMGLMAGTTYTLTFYAADRYWSDGVQGFFPPDPFSVSLGGTAVASLTDVTPPAGTTPGTFAWTPYTVTFTATGASESLQFATAGTLPASYAACQANFVAANCADLDTVFSNVAVIPDGPATGTPEPSTFAMLIPALGGLALAVRRRYKTQL